MNLRRVLAQGLAIMSLSVIPPGSLIPKGDSAKGSADIQQSLGFVVAGLKGSDPEKVIAMSQVTEKMSAASVSNLKASIEGLCKAVDLKVEEQTTAGYLAAYDKVLAIPKEKLDAIGAEQKALLQASSNQMAAAKLNLGLVAAACVPLADGLMGIFKSPKPEYLSYAPKAESTFNSLNTLRKNTGEWIESAFNQDRSRAATAFESAAGLKKPSAKEINALANKQLADAKVGATIKEEGSEPAPAAKEPKKKEEGGFKLPF